MSTSANLSVNKNIKKTKTENKQNVITVELPPIIKVLIWALVAGVYVVAPYWNGLYFYQNFLPVATAITLISIIVGIWLWSSQTELRFRNFWKSFYPYLLGIGVIYFLDMIIYPAQKASSVEGVIRFVSLFGIVMLLSILLQSLQSRKIFLGLLILLGTWTSVFALANGYGTLHSPGALMQPDNRLASVFQYANSNAAFMVVFIVISFFYPLLIKKSWLKSCVTISTYIMLLNLILTYSRGSWLTFAAMVVLLLIFMPKDTRASVIYTNISPLLVFAGTLSLQTKAVLTSHASLGWLSLAGGIAATAVLSFVIFKWAEKRTNTSLPKLFKILIVAVVVLGLGLGGFKMFQHGTHNSIIQRIKEINFYDHSVQERFVYYKDGIKMLAAHPLFGDGYGAWESLFQKYQYFPYWSKHEHSYLIQLLVETGLAGLFLFVAAIIFYIRSAIVVMKRSAIGVIQEQNNGDESKILNHDQKIISLISIFAVLAELIHTSIDFDMSYGSMNFMFWGLMVVGANSVRIGRYGNSYRVQPIPAKTALYYFVGIAAAALSLLISITSDAANYYISQASSTTKNPQRALMLLDNAKTLERFNGQYALEYAQVEDQLYTASKQRNDALNAIQSANQAVQLAPNDPSILMQASQILYKYGQITQALDDAKQAYNNGIYGTKYTEQYLIYLTAQSEENLKKNPKLSKQYEQQVMNVWDQVQNRVDFIKHLPSYLPPEVTYDITDQMKLRVAETYLMMGNKEKALGMLKPIVNSKDSMVAFTAKMVYNVMVDKHMVQGKTYQIPIASNQSVDHEYQLLQQMQ